MRHRIVQLSAAVLLALAAFARSPQAQPPVAVGATAPALNVFLDCERMFCDFDYFRTEMTWVNWVRDRAVADVHILVSTQETGAGGSEYTLNFIGLRAFAGLQDTLKYVAPPTATRDEGRKGIEQILKVGLVRFMARTPGAD